MSGVGRGVATGNTSISKQYFDENNIQQSNKPSQLLPL